LLRKRVDVPNGIARRRSDDWILVTGQDGEEKSRCGRVNEKWGYEAYTGGIVLIAKYNLTRKEDFTCIRLIEPAECIPGHRISLIIHEVADFDRGRMTWDEGSI
jgi:hypothetical protein